MNQTTHDTFYVGANVLVVRDNKILLGKRKNVAGHGTWALPGGHLDQGEEIMGAAARELKEETGLTADSYTFVALVNNSQREDNKHYIQFGFLAEGVTGEPQLLEPDACSEWQWFDLNQLPEIVFGGHQKLIQLFREGSFFSDKP